MPMWKKVKSISELHETRAKWWEWCYAMRTEVKTLPSSMRDLLITITADLPHCTMTVFGGPPHDWPPAEGYRQAARYSIPNVDWLIPWFLTPEGWEEYEQAFQSLPDLSTHPCGKLPKLYTLSTSTAEIEPNAR